MELEGLEFRGTKVSELSRSQGMPLDLHRLRRYKSIRPVAAQRDASDLAVV